MIIFDTRRPDLITASGKLYSRETSRRIGGIHILLGGLCALIYLAAVIVGHEVPLFAATPVLIFLFLLSGIYQFTKKPVGGGVIWALATLDVFLVLALIWSPTSLYPGMPTAGLKSPSYLFLLAILALQGTRLDFKLVLFLGGLVVLGRVAMLLWALAQGAVITSSYTEFLRSSSVMLSAELELNCAVILFSVFLAEVVRKSARRPSVTHSTQLPERREPELEPVPQILRVDDDEDFADQEYEQEHRHSSFETANNDAENAWVPDRKDGKVRILIAEDNSVNMVVLDNILSAYDLDVFKAEDGEEAVELYGKLVGEGRRPDVILLDIEMPYLSGHEVCKTIRNIERQNQWICAPIIAVSALGMESDKEASKIAGMNDHLVKPVKRDELLQVIVQAFAENARPKPQS